MMTKGDRHDPFPSCCVDLSPRTGLGGIARLPPGSAQPAPQDQRAPGEPDEDYAPDGGAVDPVNGKEIACAKLETLSVRPEKVPQAKLEAVRRSTKHG